MTKRKTLALAVSAVCLTACTSTQPAKFLYKPGVTIAGKQAAVDECRIASFRDIPQTMATDVKPGFNSPGTLQCNTFGGTTTCNRIGAINIPASANTYDVNAGLRDRFIEQCLQQNGFTITSIPLCKTTAEKSKAAEVISQGGIPTCATGQPLQ
ncbi:hypothetical protein [Mesorhizobium sp. M0816]|uniref:hypothetical protein n=1 Tax=Mesorhizobium sp. M0816 TaxID=2957006 RepID=UPI00333BDB93